MSSYGHGPGERRHSTGGDLRGGKSRPGARPPASYQGRRARIASKRPEGEKPVGGQHQDGPKGVLPKEGKTKVADHALYQGMGKVMAEALGLVKEQTKTTDRGEKTKGNMIPREQSNRTRTKADIKNKMKMAKKIGPDDGQLPDHTVYHYMGMIMAESLGLVSEDRFDYMKDTPKGTARTKKAQSDAARAETAANRKASAAAKKARGGDDPKTTTTEPKSASNADPTTPGQKAVARRFGRSSTA